MNDIRKALKKAGLASEKELRQARHRDRVRRKELGKDGLAAEQQQHEAARRATQARRREHDRELEQAHATTRAAQERQARLEALLHDEDLLGREGGPRRYFFEAPGGRIAFVDVTPGLARRLAQGDAAIIAAHGIARGGVAVVSGKVAHALEQLDAERIVVWHARR